MGRQIRIELDKGDGKLRLERLIGEDEINETRDMGRIITRIMDHRRLKKVRLNRRRRLVGRRKQIANDPLYDVAILFDQQLDPFDKVGRQKQLVARLCRSDRVVRRRNRRPDRRAKHLTDDRLETDKQRLRDEFRGFPVFLHLCMFLAEALWIPCRFVSTITASSSRFDDLIFFIPLFLLDS